MNVFSSSGLDQGAFWNLLWYSTCHRCCHFSQIDEFELDHDDTSKASPSVC